LVRLNKQWRLILEIVEGAAQGNRVRILKIDDYH
jgi:plasmid maintenance system killer protein